jgi:hypothetical protein
VIDNGSELFTGLSAGLAPGSAPGGPGRNGIGSVSGPVSVTAKANTSAPSRGRFRAVARGFEALRRFDQPGEGGNGDGKIDAQDAVYSKLLIWIDANHDGVSQPGELFSLAQLGITSISLSVEDAGWSDAYGNQFKSRAAFVRDGKTLWAYDVGLLTGK